MKNLYQYILATLIVLSGALALFSGYQVNRRGDNTMPADVIKTFELQHKPTLVIDYENIRSQFKADELTDPSTTLPSNVNLPAQREIYQAAKNCFQTKPPRFAPQSAEYKALIWEQYRCGKLKKLPPGFFDNPPYMHLSGQSYAQLAPDAGLSVTAPRHMREVARLKQADPQWRVIAELTRDSLKDLYLGAALISDPLYLLIRTETAEGSTRPAQYKVFDAALWATYMKQSGRRARPMWHGLSDQCEQIHAAYCWSHIKSQKAEVMEQTFKFAMTLFVGLILGTFFVGTSRYRRRLRQIREDRVLLARVTAHELRTPVTNLKLIASTLSRTKSMEDIAKISADFQDQIRRLSLLTEASLLLLDAESPSSSNNADQPTELISSVIDSLRDLTTRRGIRFENSVSSNDLENNAAPTRVKCQLGMLQLCIENLLDNALNHGKPPISLDLSIKGNELWLEVRDSGSFSATIRATSGLGIGLDVVKSATRRMGGSLHILEDPTRVQLRLRMTE